MAEDNADGRGVFNIEAKAPAMAVPPGSPDRVVRQQLRLMLQALLAERFKLRLHRESKEVAAFELRVGKNGPRLAKAAERDCTEAPSTPKPCHVFHGGPARGSVGQTVTLGDLADYLSEFVGRLVVDRTDVRGSFDIELPGWSRGTEVATSTADDAREPAPDPSAPSIFSVLQGLGLTLESSKARVDMLVIDHAERPTED